VDPPSVPEAALAVDPLPPPEAAPDPWRGWLRNRKLTCSCRQILEAAAEDL
jgi:hypothetical protein